MIGVTYDMTTIAEAMGGRFVKALEHWPIPEIDRVIIDSRNADPTAGSLFIALRGPRHDGHDHLGELWSKNIHNFVVEEAQLHKVKHGNLIVVDDALVALQRFAAWHRSHFAIPVIGITGSSGKTIVKEWLWQMLHHEENIVRSPGSWNSQVGVPLSVLRMGPEHTLGIFEAGISQPGEMEKLEPIIRPTLGVLTNIGDAHDEGFGGRSDLKLWEKTKLFQRSETYVYEDQSCISGNKEPAHREAQLLPLAPRRDWTMCNCDEQCYVTVNRTARLADAWSVEILHKGSPLQFTIPFSDYASLENGLSCITLLLHMGKSVEWINERLAKLVPVDLRFRTLAGVHGITLIDDNYSNELDHPSGAVDQQRHLARGRRQVVVLSDWSQFPKHGRKPYQFRADWMSACGIDTYIGIGPGQLEARERLPAGARVYADVDAMLAAEDPKQFAGAVILVRGARRFGFERIIARWQQQVHGTELVIDLEAIRHNLNHYRASVAPGVRTMAMVKAFGYGSGALELARLFEHERVQYLGVAYADEGIELRTHGITMPIMVMNPEPVDMGTLHRFRLETEVYDQRSLSEAITAAKRMDDAPPIHIKLDTGMHRLGFVESELPELLNTLGGRGPLKVASILSHLVASEEPAQDDFTRTQIATFTRMATAIGDVLGYKPLWHMANTAGIARWPEVHFDMVRLGIGMHGIGANAQETAKLMPTVTLRTPIAQLKQLHTGDTVGYNRRGVINGERTIATLPIGYADGFSRRLGNGVGRVWIAGQAAPVVGNVCMDMCMVDVTGIPCSVGDMAIVFDAQHPVTEVAQAMGTIPYEVLTSISQRVKRVYVRG